jgi:hypothetical protein
VLANLQAATILARRKLERYAVRRKRCAAAGRSGAKRRGVSSAAAGKRRARP